MNEYSCFDIARALMNRLWIIYDGGGISYGRAERSALLESVMNLASMKHRFEGLPVEALVEEAIRRTPPRWAIHPESFVSLRCLSFEHFTWLVFDHIAQYYAQDPMTEISPGCYLSLEEKRLADAIAHALDVKWGAEILKARGIRPSAAELIAEGRERKRGGQIS
jgi:hypothetical protein